MNPELCPLVSKRCNIEDNVSKIKDNTDRPKITLKNSYKKSLWSSVVLDFHCVSKMTFEIDFGSKN